MNTITEKQYKVFDNFVESHDSFIICGHKEPDGDCIASSLVLRSMLQQKGKPSSLLSQGPFKKTEIKKYEPLFKNEFKPLSTNKDKIGLFIVDCSEYSRLGEDIENQVDGYDTFIIDHHLTAENTDNSIIIPSVPATSFLIQLLYEHCFNSIKKEDANILFLGLATDTGFFRFLGEQTEEVFLGAARLVQAGVTPRDIADTILTGKPFSTRQLLGIVLSRAKTYFDGKVIITYETIDETHKYAKNGRDNDAMYQALLATENVEAAVFIRQETDIQCTAGFRSKGDLDVSKIAASFGGGGHKNASGLAIKEKIETFIPRILEEFAKIL